MKLKHLVLISGLVIPATANADPLMQLCAPTAWHAGVAAYHVWCSGNGWVGVNVSNASQVAELARHQPFNYRLTGNSIDCNPDVCGAAFVPEITGIYSPGSSP